MSSADNEQLMDLAVTWHEEIASGVHAFELRDPAGGVLPEFTAGAHVTVRTPGGASRKYSLCNDPAESDRYVIAVKRDATGRGGSMSMADSLRPGDTIQVAAPRNDFALRGRAKQYIFIAGGIGITPILSMIRHLMSSGHDRFKLYYCSRDPESTAFREELCAAELRGRVKIHHDFGEPQNSLDLWPILENPAGAHVYCCGPRGLMDAVRDMTGHWPMGSVHFESFGVEAAARRDNTAFTVKLARSGKTLEVSSESTVLEALREQGVRVTSSCESGTCGSCKVRLLEGEVDHRDLVLSEQERTDHMMVCVSRAASACLTLDL